MSAHAGTAELSVALAESPGERLPRLLKAVSPDGAMTLDEHERAHGPLPAAKRHRRDAEIIELVDQAGLRGRGGAGFPTARKMRAVGASRRDPVVVVNATEGEPASAKDRALMTSAPHLVLDGAILAARSLGSQEVLVAVCETALTSAESVGRAIAERRDARRHVPRITLIGVAPGYVIGQESALISALNGDPGVPSFTPPAPIERGVAGLPTMVSNAETYAHIALICRHGPRWFRELGTAAEPGSALVTLSGCVASPGVYEIELGLELRQLVSAAGGVTHEPQAVLVGGYGGAWIGAEHLTALGLSDASLEVHGGSVGAGVVLLLDRDACPVSETLRTVQWLAAESAGQCGPCVYGLQAIAGELARIAEGRCDSDPAVELGRLAQMVRGRGACAHPDGACALVMSAIDTFGQEFAEHASDGPCAGCVEPSTLPFPSGG